MATVKRRGELELVVVNGAKAARELGKVERANLGVAKSHDASTKSAGEHQKGLDLLTGNLKGLVAGLGAAAASYLSLEGAKKLMQWGAEAAKVRDLESAFNAFNRTAGRDGPAALADLRKAVQGTIADVELMRRANLLMMLEVPMERVGDIAKIARNAALATGQDVSYMLESLSVALARQSKLWLDNLGIIVDADKAKKSYAATVGKTVEKLTEEESKLAFINAALDAGLATIERSGGLLVGAADPYARLEASAANLSATLKGRLVPATAAIAGNLSDTLTSVDSLIDKVDKWWSKPSFAAFIAVAAKVAKTVSGILPEGIPGIEVGEGGTAVPGTEIIPTTSRAEYEARSASAEQNRRYARTLARLASRLDELDAEAERLRLMRTGGKVGALPGAGAAELLTTFEEIDVDAAIENLRGGFETFEEFLRYKDAIGEAAGGVYTLANAFEYLGFQVDNYATVASNSLEIARFAMDSLGDAYMQLWAGQAKAFPAAMQMIAREAQARIAAIGAVAAIDAAKYTYMGIAAMAQGLTFAQASGFFAAAGKAALVATAAGAGVAIIGNQISGLAGGIAYPETGASGAGGIAGGESGLGGRVNSVNVTRTAPTSVTITHNYYGPVTFRSQAESDAAAIQEAIDRGQVVLPEQEVA